MQSLMQSGPCAGAGPAAVGRWCWRRQASAQLAQPKTHTLLSRSAIRLAGTCSYMFWMLVPNGTILAMRRGALQQQPPPPGMH